MHLEDGAKVIGQFFEKRNLYFIWWKIDFCADVLRRPRPDLHKHIEEEDPFKGKSIISTISWYLLYWQRRKIKISLSSLKNALAIA